MISSGRGRQVTLQINHPEYKVLSGLLPILLNNHYPNVNYLLEKDHIVPPEDIRTLIINAILLLRKIEPILFDIAFKSTKYIYIFSGSNHNSFAHELYPGTIFLNISGEVSIPSLIEDIIHQSFHCVFSDVEFSSLFVYDKPNDEPISNYMTGPSMERSISILHHSLLTEAVSIIALSSYITKSEELEYIKVLEAVGRIAFLIKKLSIDLTYVKTIKAINRTDHKHYYRFIDLASEITINYQKVIASLSFFNQKYNFSLSTFLSENENKIQPLLDQFSLSFPLLKE